jgi:hypothetical protein
MTRARFFGRSLALVLALAAPVIAASCGGDSKTTSPAPDSSGGAGGDTQKPEPLACEDLTCKPFDVPDAFMQPDIPACCASKGRCGLDSSILMNYGLAFGEVCQPKDQKGELTPDCADSAPLMLPGSTLMLPALKGCCREETGTCGYDLVIAGLIDPGLGCVDSTPFLEGGTAPKCDTGAGGAGAGN